MRNKKLMQCMMILNKRFLLALRIIHSYRIGYRMQSEMKGIEE